MGGKVFTHSSNTSYVILGSNQRRDPNGREDASPALHTPRMSPATYFRLRDHLVDALADHYTRVIVPREAPEKTSYGDVDVLVEGPIVGHVSIEDLAKSMGATRWVKRSSRAMSFAIPDAAEEREKREEVYRQVDVYVCRLGEMDWAKMIKSDGDAWTIIGTMLRPVGITVNDVGMFVRVREIETEPGWGRDKAMILLTGDPGETMDFLGLDQACWEKGFETMKELFDWIAGMRWLVLFDKRGKKKEEEEEGQKEKGRLKRNDKRRMEKREMYRRWMKEYLPSCCPNTSVEENGSDKVGVMRERVLQEALDRFKKRAEYDARLRKWKMSVAMNNLWRRAADSLPIDGEKKKGLTVRGLKKRIDLFPPNPQEEDPGEDEVRRGKNLEANEPQQRNAIPGLVIPQFRIGEEGTVDEGEFLNWVRNNWEQVYQAEKQRADEERKRVGKV